MRAFPSARATAAVAALTSSGVAAEPALAFALVYHAVHLIPSTGLGLLAISLPWE